MPKKTLGQLITSLRKGHNWSQNQLGKEIGTYTKNVSRWELDEVKPTLEMAAKLAATLGVSVDFLAGLEKDVNSEPLLVLLSKKLDSLSKEQKKALEVVIRAF